MTSTRVLLLGGHGRISLQLTPLLLSRNWNVTSVIRDPSHGQEIMKLGHGQPGEVEVLIESLDNVRSPDDAQRVLNKVKPDVVVWCAGAGGKGGKERTFLIDRDVAKHYITSAMSTQTVKKFLLISYLASRRNRASWWTDEDQKTAEEINAKLADYHIAKIEADEYFASRAKIRTDQDPAFQAINLRPGTLNDNPASGKVALGRTPTGQVARGDVAKVAAELLARADTRGWYDLVQGDDSVEEAVDKVVLQGLDTFEGENFAEM